MRNVMHLIAVVAFISFMGGCAGSKIASSSVDTSDISPHDDALNAHDAEIYADNGLTQTAGLTGKKAITEHSRLLQFDPTNVAAYIGQGNACSALGLQHLAVSDFTQAISIDPNASDAYLGLARAYYDQEQYDPAIAQYTNVLTIAPENHEAFAGRALAYQKQGRSEEFRRPHDMIIVMLRNQLDAMQRKGRNRA